MGSNVMAIGAGLISGRTCMYNDFTVYTNNKGFHGLSVGVDGPSRSEIKYNDNHDGTVKVSYMPKNTGEYKVTVKFDGINVKGSPFHVRIRGAEEPRSALSPLSSFSKSALDTTVSSYGAASRVRVSGRGLYSAITNVQNEISIDVREAGPGKLQWSIEGPGHVESKNRGLEDGVYRLYYKPDSSGEYTIKIKYAERDVQGSPYKIRVL